ncbi:MAG TPA: hypothetical protein VG602_01960 [Actinomycetota bacterium]|nr:hypothetical protein [Actinomycetota bacterium]
MADKVNGEAPPRPKSGAFAFSSSGSAPRNPKHLLKQRRFRKTAHHHARPRRGFLILTAAGTALVLAAGAFVVSRPEPAGAALVLGFQEGETQRYRLTASMDSTMELGPGQVVPVQASVTETIEMRVVGVDAEGHATVDFHLLSFHGQAQGQRLEPPQRKQFRMVLADDGRILETAAGLAYVSLEGEPGNAPCFPLLPDHPVNPGDRWDVEHRQRLPQGMGHMKVHALSEFIDYDETVGARTALIESKIVATIDAEFDSADLRRFTNAPGEVPAGIEASSFGQVDVSQTVWLDTNGGDVVRGYATADFQLTLRMTGGTGPTGSETGHLFGQMQLQLDRL